MRGEEEGGGAGGGREGGGGDGGGGGGAGGKEGGREGGGEAGRGVVDGGRSVSTCGGYDAVALAVVVLYVGVDGREEGGREGRKAQLRFTRKEEQKTRKR